MTGLKDLEIRIALSLREAAIILNAVQVLGKHARTESANETESEDYRERWSEYVEEVLPIYKNLLSQIKKQEDEEGPTEENA